MCYTTSNATKFYYDDFYAGPKQVPVDLTPPTVANIQAPSANSVSVLFSEPIEQPSAETITNYFANNFNWKSSNSYSSSGWKNSITFFTKAFTNGIQNKLTVSNLRTLREM